MNLGANLRVKAGGRLVEKNQLRIIQQGQGQRQALLLPTRQGSVEGILFFFQLQPLQKFGQVHVVAVERREHIHRFVDANFFRQIRSLQADANAVFELLPLLVRVESEDGNFAAAARTQPLENLDGRRFACAVRSKQAKNFACADLEIDPLNGLHVTVRLFESLNRNCG